MDGFKDDFRIRKISEVLARTRQLPRQRSYAELLSSADDTVPPTQPAKKQTTQEDRTLDDDDDGGEQSLLCDLCKFSDRHSEAVLYCLECAKMVCQVCAEEHINAAITKDHDIVPANSLLPTESVCATHGSELLKYFCQQPCAVPVCMACTYGEQHRGHEVTRLSEHTTGVRDQLKDLLDECRQRMPELHSKTNQLDLLEQTLNSKEKSAQKAILLRTLEDISKIRSNQSKMAHELEKICRNKYNELQAKKKEIQDVKEILDFAETLLLRGQDLQVIGVQKELMEKLKKITNSSEIISSGEISFTDLGKYEGLVEDVELMHKDESSTRSAIMADIKSVVTQMRMFSAGRSDTKPELLCKTGRKGCADGEFNFPSGVAILPSGQIAVADLHNHRVQLFSADGEYRSQFGHDDFKPCGLAVNRDGLLAVTDCNLSANCVKLYTADGQLTQSLGRGEFDYPFSVAVTSKSRYVVSDPAINKVTVINTDGSLHRRFGTRSKFCFYLTVNRRDEIILSDWYSHCVKVFSPNGQLLRKVGCRGTDNGQLLIPLGVVTDMRGNILVLDCKCSRLSMFAPDGRFVKQLISKDDGVEFVRALALSKEGRLVITTGDNKRDVPNELYIYQI